jgi:hypothetical protein
MRGHFIRAHRAPVVMATVVVLACTPLLAQPPPAMAASEPSSLAAAYTFLDTMLDQHATGNVRRLPQSYTGGFLQKDGYTDSVTYDDALMIDAFLARGTSDDVSRARIIGDSLLYVQANDAKKDGRVRAAYGPAALTSPATISMTDPTSDVGNMAWVGQALVELYAKTSTTAYLTGATRIATWIQANAADTRGAGGYTGGRDDADKKITWKSTEHNLDLYAFFTMLTMETGDQTWATRAASARRFAVSMWQGSDHIFWTGTGSNGRTVNKDMVAEDTQSWSYLALGDSVYRASLDSEIARLAVTDGRFTGVGFSTADRSKVWFEGTAHLADALLARNDTGDAAQARSYLDCLALAQTTAPNHDGKGIVAASRDGLRTGDDNDRYYASLHTGTTSWYLLALQGRNPFHLLT